MHLVQQLQTHLPNVGVGRRRAAHLKVVAPLTRVHGHDDFSLGALRQHAASLLGLGTHRNQFLVIPVCGIHGFQPDAAHLCGIGVAIVADEVLVRVASELPEAGLADSDGVVKLVVAIVAVAGGLLGIGGEAVSYQLMGHAAVNSEPGGDSAVLKDTLVSALDDAGDELVGGAVANLALGLVAGPAGPFNLTQQLLSCGAKLDMGFHRDDTYHYSSPPCSVSNCPA